MLGEENSVQEFALSLSEFAACFASPDAANSAFLWVWRKGWIRYLDSIYFFLTSDFENMICWIILI